MELLQKFETDLQSIKAELAVLKSRTEHASEKEILTQNENWIIKVSRWGVNKKRVCYTVKVQIETILIA